MFQFKPVTPPKWNPDLWANTLIEELGRQAEIVLRMYRRVVATWRHQPDFEVRVSLSRRQGAVAAVSTDDEIFHYVEKGTRIRWAVMSKGFRAKSRYRVLSSYPGRGGAVIVGRRAMQARNIAPRPGIKGREWTQEILRRRRRDFLVAMWRANSRGLKRATRG